jgi:hypothetical protein
MGNASDSWKVVFNRSCVRSSINAMSQSAYNGWLECSKGFNEQFAKVLPVCIGFASTNNTNGFCGIPIKIASCV